MLVRAYTYIRTLGAAGIKAISGNAVLNANYLMQALKDYYYLPYDRRCMHEVVFSADWQKDGAPAAWRSPSGCWIMGSTPPPCTSRYRPRSLEIEPTEAETRETLDAFIQALREIDREDTEDPTWSPSTPHYAVSRLDEARAAASRTCVGTAGVGIDHQ